MSVGLRLRSAFSITALATALFFVSAGVAWASFNSTATASGSYSTATLNPPTNLAASRSTCTVSVAASVNLTWTTTTSTWADGYEVLRSLVSGGPYVAVATVPGQSATSFTDGSLLFSTTYYYVAKATKAGWRSAATSSVSITTPSALCA